MLRIAGFALFLGVCSVLVTLAGAPFAIGALLFVPIAAMSFIVMLFPGKESRGNARITALFALLFAVLPVLKPWIDQLAFARQEVIRARETAPIYMSLREGAETIARAAEAFRREHGVYPVAVGSVLQPMIARDGSRLEGPRSFAVAVNDPFDPASPLRVLPVGLDGVLVVSVGQDGLADIPPLSEWAPIDVPGTAPLAPFAYAAIEPKRFFFDREGSPLAPGDAVEWFPSRGEAGPSLDEVFAPLSEAWDQVNRESPWPDQFSRETHPSPEQDLAAARRFLQQGRDLEALCAASRAALFRSPHSEMVKTRQLTDIDKIRGLALMRLGHIRMAGDALIDYIALVPNDAEAHYHLGLALRAAGLRDLSRRHLFAALQVQPGSPWVARAQAALDE